MMVSIEYLARGTARCLEVMAIWKEAADAPRCLEVMAVWKEVATALEQLRMNDKLHSCQN